ncbi:uncharacterized protein PGTG_17226 [Puccinia graminis f. sp. tritici CRL 75-36-700-3]|uniref:Uncharacterized protein n=1 Tax=Puccinia graminis f. sp. tritici (strain CRL 75-36-700-3 / race SCCL) TaxID=418459 RepID=E3L329_PUCGT|nr:uncharacterized protein PGTG_17226 [Puccinia graminis f. sp. tritici CRL 75-36-700-3]EFP90954.2 hypothetical protein PGTG_17226 [Puccinia graminis f. sp. tritici CRL 75-36-700-3]
MAQELDSIGQFHPWSPLEAPLELNWIGSYTLWTITTLNYTTWQHSTTTNPSTITVGLDTTGAPRRLENAWVDRLEGVSNQLNGRRLQGAQTLRLQGDLDAGASRFGGDFKKPPKTLCDRLQSRLQNDLGTA